MSGSLNRLPNDSPYADVFLVAGRKPTFITDLRNMVSEIQSASYDRTQHRINVRMATSEVSAKLTSRVGVHISGRSVASRTRQKGHHSIRCC